MKTYSKPWRIFFRSLIAVIGALVAVLIIGTIYGFARPADSQPLFTFGGQAETVEAVPGQNGDICVFSGLGRLRIPLSNSSTLILSIAFPYPAPDSAFTEELAAKIGELRSISSGYFSSLPAEELIVLDEDAAKAEILRRYNAALRLGRIEALYFSDLMIIDGNL